MKKQFFSTVLAVMVLCFLALPGFGATTVYDFTYNFDASDSLSNPLITRFFSGGDNAAAARTTWTSQDLSTTDRLLGPFGNTNDAFISPLATEARGVRLTLGTAGGPAFSAVTISFQLWAINTWDGNSTTNGPDHFQVGVTGGSVFSAPTSACSAGPGSASLFCPTLANTGATGSIAPDVVRTGAQAGFFVNPALPQQGIAANGVSIYNISITNAPVTPVNGQLIVWFAGWQDQGTLNEAWAINSLRVTALSSVGNGNGNGNGNGGDPVIPEPSTMVLGGLGLALLLIARGKAKKA